MTGHAEEILERDFERIQLSLKGMAELAVRSLRDCVRALEDQNALLAQAIVLRDQRIDGMERENDRYCLEFILRHQPVGTYLRFAYASLRVNFELERVGGYAESIARQLLALFNSGSSVPVDLFREISDASISMLEKAALAFDQQDAELAKIAAEEEDEIDNLRNRANLELLRRVERQEIPLRSLTALMTIARRFERVSDQAKNICEETIYIVTGQYAKHRSAQGYDVLFVDDHHGFLSRLGEAIGDSLHHPEFRFASAGVDPRPQPPLANRYFAEKGLIPPSRAPQALRDLPDLSGFQVIIALTPAAKDALPAPTRKVAHFQWLISDPSNLPWSQEEIRAGYDRAYQLLSERLHELVRAILGTSKPY